VNKKLWLLVNRWWVNKRCCTEFKYHVCEILYVCNIDKKQDWQLAQRITNRRVSCTEAQEVRFIKSKIAGYVHKMHAIWNTHLITNCIWQNCVWKANGLFSCQEILQIFWYQKIYYHKILRGVTFITLFTKAHQFTSLQHILSHTLCSLQFRFSGLTCNKVFIYSTHVYTRCILRCEI